MCELVPDLLDPFTAEHKVQNLYRGICIAQCHAPSTGTSKHWAGTLFQPLLIMTRRRVLEFLFSTSLQVLVAMPKP